MSTTSKAVNTFFRTAIKSEVEDIKDRIILSDRQDTIFQMYYIQRKDRCFIADTLSISPTVVDRELKTIRDKILRII